MFLRFMWLLFGKEQHRTKSVKCDFMATLHLAQEIFKLIYPVGSIYISTNTTNPSTYFGGTWVRESGGFLYGSTLTSGNTYSTGSKGSGTATNGHTLTIQEIPEHEHKIRMRNAGKWNWNDGSYAGDMLEGGYYWEGSGATFNWLIDTKPRGGGQSHNHNIPYIACSIWRRTA